MKQWMDASKQPPGSVDPKMVQGLETQLLDKYKALTGNKQVVDMEVKGDKVVMIGANGQPIEELNPMQLIGQMHQVKGQVTKLSRAFEAYAAEMGDKEARNRIMAVGKSQEALGELAKHATTQEQLQAIQMARELIPTLGADKQTELLFSLKDKIQGDLKAKLNTEGSAFVMSEAARLSSILQPSTGKGKPASLAELDKTLRLKALSEYDKLTPAQKEFAGSPTAYGEMLVQANHNRLKERAGTEEAALKPANMAADIEQKLAHAAAYRAQAAKARFDLTQDKAGITAAKGMIAALSAQIQSLEKVKAANMLVTEEEKSSYNTELAALRKEFALYNEWIKKQEGITGVVKPIVPKVNQEVDLNAFFAQFPSGSVSASSSSRQPTGAVKTFQDVQRESMFNPNLQ
jgi:hypothetical protein